jgi:Domain of unknown function (DUF4389)
VSDPIPPADDEPSQPIVEPPLPHPVRIVNNDDLQRSRLSVLVRLLLVFPHLIWLSLYSLVALVVVVVNWFATLATGRVSQRRHTWLARYLRYSVFVNSYLYVLANPYPPFHGTVGAYPVDLEIEGPDSQRRLITVFRLVLAIPAMVVTWVFNQVIQILAVLAWLVAIFIGRMPRGMEDLGLYCLRYQTQTYAYLAIVTDRYPSFAGPRS